ncbi:MAG: polymorphic toxin type 35 domain-containing protein [Candidatus Babeliales bacterium]
MKIKHLALLWLFVFGQTQQLYAQNEFSFVKDSAEAAASVIVGTCVLAYAAGKCFVSIFKKSSDKKEKRKQEEEEYQHLSFVREKQEKLKQAEQAAAQHAYELEVQNQAKRKCEEQRVYKKQTAQIFSETQQELQEHYALYQQIEVYDDIHALTPRQYRVKRTEALHDCLTGNQIWQEQTYQITHEAFCLMQEECIEVTAYPTCYGNQIQRVLHQEFVDILNGAGSLRYQQDYNYKPIASTLTRFAHAGHVHNQRGRVADAFSFADFCHGLYKLTLQVKEITCDIGAAVGRGAAKGGVNYANKLLHPFDAARDTLYGLAKTVHIIGNKAGHYTLRYMEQSLQDAIDLQQGKITYWGLVKRDVFAARQTVLDVKNALTKICHDFDYDTMLKGVEVGTAYAVESTLTSVTFGVLGMLSKNAGSGLSRFLENSDFLNLPLDPSTMQAAICYDAALADIMNASASAIEIAGGTLGEVFDVASKASPGLTVLSQNGGDGQNNFTASTNGSNSNGLMDPLQDRYKIYIEGIGEIDDNIANLCQHNKDHIMAEHHLWDRLVKDPKDFDSIARIMTKVMKEGQEDLYIKNIYKKLQNEMVKMRFLKIGVETVQVNFFIENGKKMIGNSWVRP